MPKPTLSSYVRQHKEGPDKKKEPGPFVTISRQFGCDGYRVAELLLEKINAREDEPEWSLHHKDLIEQLAQDTGLSVELIEKERLAKPSLMRDFLRGVRRSSGIDSYEIRNKLSVMVRELAYQGHVIVVGQGGASAVKNLEHGLTVRIEAPRSWRIPRISRQLNVSREATVSRMQEEDKQRKRLMRAYEERNPRIPAFNLTIDNSVLDAEKIADLLVSAMEYRGLIASEE